MDNFVDGASFTLGMLISARIILTVLSLGCFALGMIVGVIVGRKENNETHSIVFRR